MPNNRSVSTAFQKSLAAGGAAVFRQTPAPGGTVVNSLPAAGATAATDIWQEVYENGASDPTYLLVVKAGQAMPATTPAALVSA